MKTTTKTTKNFYSPRDTDGGHTAVSADKKLTTENGPSDESTGLVWLGYRSGMAMNCFGLTPEEARGLATDLLVAAEVTEATNA